MMYVFDLVAFQVSIIITILTFCNELTHYSAHLRRQP